MGEAKRNNDPPPPKKKKKKKEFAWTPPLPGVTRRVTAGGVCSITNTFLLRFYGFVSVLMLKCFIFYFLYFFSVLF